MLAGMVTLPFWSLVRFNCARNSGVEHVSCPEGCDMNTEGLGALSRLLHGLWMHIFELGFQSNQPDSAAMFPGRFPNVPDAMWNFGWNPQTMGLQGQFCGGDMITQQSQAQS